MGLWVTIKMRLWTEALPSQINPITLPGGIRRKNRGKVQQIAEPSSDPPHGSAFFSTNFQPHFLIITFLQFIRRKKLFFSH